MNINHVTDVSATCGTQSVNVTVRLERSFKGVVFARDFSDKTFQMDCHANNGTLDNRLGRNLQKGDQGEILDRLEVFNSVEVLAPGIELEDFRHTERLQSDPNSICMKTGWFSALLALGGGAMCLLGGALLATCTRLKRTAIDKVLSSNFDGYMNHKGSIN